MTGNQYKEARLRMGLNQEQLGSKLGVYRQAVARRENQQTVSKEAEIAIRALEADHKKGGAK